jgi:hypothetical protein
MWSKLGIGALILSILLLGYRVLTAVLQMGHTDRFVFTPSSLIKVLGTDNFLWINDIPVAWLQKFALTLANMPLSLLAFCLGLLFFVIHMVAAKAS